MCELYLNQHFSVYFVFKFHASYDHISICSVVHQWFIANFSKNYLILPKSFAFTWLYLYFPVSGVALSTISCFLTFKVLKLTWRWLWYGRRRTRSLLHVRAIWTFSIFPFFFWIILRSAVFFWVLPQLFSVLINFLILLQTSVFWHLKV